MNELCTCCAEDDPPDFVCISGERCLQIFVVIVLRERGMVLLVDKMSLYHSAKRRFAPHVEYVLLSGRFFG
jgi:hypothetical protein